MRFRPIPLSAASTFSLGGKCGIVNRWARPGFSTELLSTRSPVTSIHSRYLHVRLAQTRIMAYGYFLSRCRGRVTVPRTSKQYRDRPAPLWSRWAQAASLPSRAAGWIKTVYRASGVKLLPLRPWKRPQRLNQQNILCECPSWLVTAARAQPVTKRGSWNNPSLWPRWDSAWRFRASLSASRVFKFSWQLEGSSSPAAATWRAGSLISWRVKCKNWTVLGWVLIQLNLKLQAVVTLTRNLNHVVYSETAVPATSSILHNLLLAGACQCDMIHQIQSSGPLALRLQQVHLEPWYPWFQVWFHEILHIHEFKSYEFIGHEMSHMNSWSWNII